MAWRAVQLLGQLYPQMPGKRAAALAQFQRATQKHTSSADVWQILAELLAPVDAQGMHPPLLPGFPDWVCRGRHVSMAGSGEPSPFLG